MNCLMCPREITEGQACVACLWLMKGDRLMRDGFKSRGGDVAAVRQATASRPAQPAPNKCRECDKPFAPFYRGGFPKQFCSESCKKAVYRRRARTNEYRARQRRRYAANKMALSTACVECGKPCTPRHGRIYCSNACKCRAWLQRSRVAA